MTSRERVLAAFLHELPDRTPSALIGADLIVPEGREITSDAACERLAVDVRLIRVEPTAVGQGFDEYLRSLPGEVLVGNLEQLRRYHAWDYRPERSRQNPVAPSPLRDVTRVADLEGFRFPDFGGENAFSRLRARVAEYHARGFPVFVLPPRLGGTLFEAAWRLRGFEDYLCELAQGHEVSLWLLDRLADLGCYYAAMIAAADADVLFIGDDVGEPTRLMLSPDLWRRTIGPRMRRIIGAARAVKPTIHVCYHSDGHFTELLEYLVEIGVDAIEPVQPDVMDPAAIKERFGRQLTLVGCVGRAWWWQHANPPQVRAEVRRMKARFSDGGGLILAPAYDLMSCTPWANVEAFYDEVRRA